MGLFQRFINGISTKVIGYPIIFSGGLSGNSNLRENDVVGSIAHCIATHVSKLQPSVVRQIDNKLHIVNDPLNTLISLRPNKEMSTFDFLYRMASDLVYTSNAFAVIFYDNDYLNVKSIVPVTVNTFEIIEDLKGNLFFRFQWEYDNKTYTVSYDDVIHLKSRYNKKRFMGTPPSADLQRSVGLLETSYKGVESTVKNNSTLRGYLQYDNHIDEEELKKKVKEFHDAYMSAENSGNIAGVDPSLKYVPLNQQITPIPTMQIVFFRDNLYRYYNISESILMSKYTESEWSAFWESVIEPIAVMLKQEFTYKLLSDRERGFGKSIAFNSNKLQYATTATRQTVAGAMFDRGIITINEYREIMNMPYIEDGDIRMVSLNYVRARDQSAYQLGEKIERGDTENEDRGNNQSV